MTPLKANQIWLVAKPDLGICKEVTINKVTKQFANVIFEGDNFNQWMLLTFLEPKLHEHIGDIIDTGIWLFKRKKKVYLD